jgi:hypothetical protein
MELQRMARRDEPDGFLVIRPDARLWSFRLSGGMSTSAFMKILAPPEDPAPN